MSTTTRPGIGPLRHLSTGTRTMSRRDPTEEHRASTPLELLFDLCFVVAVGQAANQWHHVLAGNHIGWGLIGYLEVFTAIWWAWMGFTWFATFYDTDDLPYRVLTFVQILGALGIAASVPTLATKGDLRGLTLSYVILRVATAVQWARAARADPADAGFARRWLVGTLACQAAWVALAFSRPDRLQLMIGFIVLIICEFAVPAWAQLVPNAPEPHPDHIAERYGLFTLIVLGESVSAATLAVRGALDGGRHIGAVIAPSIAAATIAFCMWWFYFAHVAEFRYDRTRRRSAFIWGYGHHVIFAATAAVGAALAAAFDITHEIPDWSIGLALAIPIAAFLVVIILLVPGKVALGAGERGAWLAASTLIVPITAAAGLIGRGAVIIVCALFLVVFLVAKNTYEAYRLAPR